MNELGLGLVFGASDAASGVIQRVGHGLLETVGSASKAGQAIKSYFREFSVGMAMFGAGAMALHMLSPATEEAKEFGKAIALVATETDLAIFPQKRMAEVALQLGNTFGKLPKDEAVAMYEAVGMGANNAASATALMTGASRLSVAGNADLKTSIDALGGAMRAYGADWSKAGDYADTMFVAMTSGKTTVQELAGSLGRVTSMASSLGLSFEETTAAISAMTSTGIEANQAVTGLHGAFANILHPEAHAGAEAARLGIHFDSVTLKSKGLMGMLESITGAKGFKGVETIKKLFPSIEGFNAIMQLTAGNMTGFKGALDAMGSKQGAAAKGFEIMAATAAFQEDRMKSLKSSALILIGQALEPLAVGAMKIGNAMLEAFNKLPAPMRDFLVRGFAMAATLLTVVGGVIAVKAAIGILGIGLGALGVSFAGVLAAAVPVLLVIGAIALAFIAFREAYDQNLGGIGDMVDRIYQKVSLFVRALGQLFSQGGFSGAVLDELDKGNEGVENFAIRVWGAVQRIITFWDHLTDSFFEGLAAAGPIFDSLSRAFQRLGDAFGGAVESIDGDKASSEFDKWGSTGSKVGAVISKVATWIILGLTAVVNVITGVAESWDAISDALSGSLDPFGEVIDEIGALARELGIVDSQSTDFSYSWMAVGSVIGGAFKFIAGIAGAALGAIGGVLKGLVNVFGGVVEVISGIANGDFAEVWHGMKRIVYGVVSGILAIIGGMVTAIATAVDALGSLMGKDFGAKKSVKDLFGGLDKDLHAGLGLDTPFEGKALGQERAEAADKKAARAYDIQQAQSVYYQPTASPSTLYATQAAAADAGQGASSSDIGMSVASALASNPPVIMSTVTATMNVDGQVLGEISLKAQRGESLSSETPVSISR